MVFTTLLLRISSWAQALGSHSRRLPVADPVSRTSLVKADLPGAPGLRSGQFARVTLALGTRDVLTIPEASLVRRGQLDGVFVLEAGGRVTDTTLEEL